MYKASSLPNTRIDVADILRGIAIGGIVLIHFIEHMNFYSFPEKLTALDNIVWDSIFFIFAGKMYAIFAILFGLSLYIQHDNQAQKGVDFRPRFIWRMILLMIWGIIDLFFYNGDILFLYAVCGLLVLPLVRTSSRVLWIIFGFLLLQPVELFYMIWGGIDPSVTPLNLNSMTHYMAMAPAQADGSILDVAKVGIVHGLPCNFLWAIENGRMTQTVCFFIFGILLGRLRLFYDEGNNLQIWKRIMIGSIIAFAVLFPLYKLIPGAIDNKTVANSAGVMFNMWKNFSMMLFYVSGIILLFYKTKCQKALMCLAPYGKMSLTNYIGQSIIGGFIFYGWGLGLYQYCGHTMSLLLGAATVFAQWMFCRWWLRTHKRGPLEEIWNRLTWIKRF